MNSDASLSTSTRGRSSRVFVRHQLAQRLPIDRASNDDAPTSASPELDELHLIFDDEDDDADKTAVPEFDIAAYARATAGDDDLRDDGADPPSGIRRSFPTLSNEVGALPNEPEEDAILRGLGGSERVLTLRVPRHEIMRHSLDPDHGYVLSLLDGMTPVADALDISVLHPLVTLRVIEEVVLLRLVE